jgi:hypothetical protein
MSESTSFELEQGNVMKYWFVAISVVLGCVLMAPATVVQADSDSGSADSGSGGKTRGGSVPELDATAGGAAIVLLLGGVAYIASRRREDDAS